ncbi:MAG TPA: hypothetical protein VGK92_06585 [Gaiellales bacterium]|jgi:hypothetical protein
MAEALILEFPGVTADGYMATNRALGIDVTTGAGEWPEGLHFHSASIGADGLVVYEIWESQAAQGRFMSERLGKALQEGGITGAPSRVEWTQLVGSYPAH